MERHGLSEQESSLKTPKSPSEGYSKNSIGVPRQDQCRPGPAPGCGCNHCECEPECNCNGLVRRLAIDPNTVTLIASAAPPVLMMPSEGSKKSIEADHGSCC